MKTVRRHLLYGMLFIGKNQTVGEKMAIKPRFSVRLSGIEVEPVHEWLMEADITVAEFNLVDVSDISSYHDTMIELIFNTEEDMTMFKLAWSDR